MKLFKWIVFAAVLTAGLGILAGCGGGGDSNSTELCFQEVDYWVIDSPPDPITSDITGAYTLTAFDVTLWEDGVLQGTFNENDPSFQPWSGTMSVTATTITQTISVSGDPPIVATGTYSIMNTTASTGTLEVDEGGVISYIDFSISGSTLSTDSGQVCFSVSLSAQSLAEPAFTDAVAPGRVIVDQLGL